MLSNIVTIVINICEISNKAKDFKKNEKLYIFAENIVMKDDTRNQNRRL